MGGGTYNLNVRCVNIQATLQLIDCKTVVEVIVLAAKVLVGHGSAAIEKLRCGPLLR